MSQEGTHRGGRLPPAAAVVIVGGGVIGASIAFHLAEAGVGDVVLVERDTFGSGSTSKAAGGVRAQFSDSLNIQLGARSLAAFERFDQRPGQAIDLRQPGYLFLLTRPEDVATFEAGVDLQNGLGVPSRMVTAAQAQQLSPLVQTDDVLAAAFSPTDGYCTPESVVLGYTTGARRLGARLFPHCEVVDIQRSGRDIVGVSTSRGQIETTAVICAAGAWSRRIGGMVGVDLPVDPYRRQIVVTGPLPDLPENFPMTIDFTTTFYFHREGPGLLMGLADPDETPGFKLERSDDWLPQLTQAIERRAPRLLETGLSTGWAGLYEVTPDHNALIGEADGIARFLYATGFSGHGFLMGPAVGETVRDLYLGREPFVDVGPLNARRFASSQQRPEVNCI